MVSRSLNNLGRLLLVVLVALAASDCGFTAPDYKLKDEIPKWKNVSDARSAEAPTANSTKPQGAENRNRRGTGAPLKSGGVKLAKAAGERPTKLAGLSSNSRTNRADCGAPLTKYLCRNFRQREAGRAGR